MRDRSRPRNRLGDLADPALIATLTEWLEQSGACEIEISAADGQALKIVLGSTPVTAAQGREICVKAPLAGHFRAAQAVQAGQAVQQGERLGFVAIGPVLLPVSSPEDGAVRALHVCDGDVVGYGAALFTLEGVA